MFYIDAPTILHQPSCITARSSCTAPHPASQPHIVHPHHKFCISVPHILLAAATVLNNHTCCIAAPYRLRRITTHPASQHAQILHCSNSHTAKDPASQQMLYNQPPCTTTHSMLISVPDPAHSTTHPVQPHIHRSTTCFASIHHTSTSQHLTSHIAPHYASHSQHL